MSQQSNNDFCYKFLRQATTVLLTFTVIYTGPLHQNFNIFIQTSESIDK